MARITYVVSKPPAVPGPQGPPGDTGPEGPQGPAGDPGPDTELRARVDPGTSGSNRQFTKIIDGDPTWSIYPEFDVRDDGATGDGVTDDTADVLVTLAKVRAAGGGTIRFTGPGTTYLLNTAVTLTPSGKMYILPIDFDNCRIKIDAGVVVKSTLGHANNPAFINVSGSYKGALAGTGSRNNWGDYWFGEIDSPNHPIYAVTASVAKGATTITTATALDAGNFAAGDLIYIRTGQTVSSSTSEPDAELNEVISAVAGTGVITLRYPTSKAYAQEYYITGTTGTTSTAVTANAANYGVQKVTGSVVRNFVLEGPGKIVYQPSSNSGEILGGHQIWGMTIKDLEVEATQGHFQNQGLFRWCKVQNVRMTINSTTANRVYLTGSTGVNDFTIENCDLNGANEMVFLHIGEGNAGITIKNTRIRQKQVVSSNALITGGSRGYDYTLTDLDLTRPGGSIMTFTGTVVDGLVLDNIRSLGASSTMTVTANNMRVGRIIGASLLHDFTDTHPLSTQQIIIRQWMYFNSTTPKALPVIPPRYMVDEVLVHVHTAFNGTTPTMTIGLVGGSATRFMTSVSLAAQARLTGTMGSVNDWIMSSTTFRQPEIIINIGGSTAGKALVTMKLSLVPTGSGV